MFDIVTVTVNYQTRDDTLAMLRSLYRDIAGSPLVVQPIVVDNASDDGVGEAIAREFAYHATPPIVIDGGVNLGFGRGNNVALRQFEASYYCLANPDLRFLPNQLRTIERLHAFMEARSEIGIVAPRLQRPDGSTQPSCMRFPSFLDQPAYRLGLHDRYRWARRRVERLHLEDVDHGETRPIDWATGAALFVRGSWFQEVGFFDDRYFMYYEDCDLCRTFWSRGWPVYYAGNICIEHGHERASAKVPGLKSIVLNPLTRAHLQSLIRYTTKWWRQPM